MASRVGDAIEVLLLQFEDAHVWSVPESSSVKLEDYHVARERKVTPKNSKQHFPSTYCFERMAFIFANFKKSLGLEEFFPS